MTKVKKIKKSIVHTNDIGDAAARHLLALDFKGHSHIYVAGAEDLTMAEATAVLGDADNAGSFCEIGICACV